MHGKKAAFRIARVIARMRLETDPIVLSVKLTTVTPDSQTLEGTLYTACSILNVVAINTRNPPPTPGVDLGAYPGDYRIIPISRIQSFQVLSLDGSGKGGGSFASAQPQIGQVDVKRLRQREEEKIKKLKEDDVNRGKGVTKEAQAIFDSFKRMYVLKSGSASRDYRLTAC